jgi:hypothetical protein
MRTIIPTALLVPIIADEKTLWVGDLRSMHAIAFLRVRNDNDSVFHIFAIHKNRNRPVQYRDFNDQHNSLPEHDAGHDVGGKVLRQIVAARGNIGLMPVSRRFLHSVFTGKFRDDVLSCRGIDGNHLRPWNHDPYIYSHEKLVRSSPIDRNGDRRVRFQLIYRYCAANNNVVC